MGQSLKLCDASWNGGDIVPSVVTLEIWQTGIEPFSREKMMVLELISVVTPLRN
jgi:hypothetical protein